MLALLPALVPAVAGLLIVALTGNWLFALLPLLSPLVAVAAWAQARHRASRAGRHASARQARALAGFREALEAAAASELQRRRARRSRPRRGGTAHRGAQPPALGAAPTGGRPAARRPSRPDDWLRLSAGIGVVSWSPPREARARRRVGAVTQPTRLAGASAGRLVDAPVEVDLSCGGVIGIVGEGPLLREAARSLARALVLQAAALHGTGGPRRDGGRRGLPAPRDGSGPTGCRTSTVPRARPTSRGDATFRALLGAGADRDRRTRLVVLDDDARLAGARAPARAVLAGQAGPVAGIVVTTGLDRLPASCSVVVELCDAAGIGLLQRLRTDRRAGAPRASDVGRP